MNTGELLHFVVSGSCAFICHKLEALIFFRSLTITWSANYPLSRRAIV